MRLFDHFRREKNAISVDALRAELEASIIEAGTQKLIAENRVRANLNNARAAIAENNPGRKGIAMSQISMYLGLYRYMSALGISLEYMKARVDMNQITNNFADLVNRVTKIRVPDNAVDYTSLTAKALRGLKPADLSGIEQMAKSLIENAMNATDIAAAPNSYVEDIISGKISLDSALSMGFAPEISVAAAETDDAISAQTNDDDIGAMLDRLANSFRE